MKWNALTINLILLFVLPLLPVHLSAQNAMLQDTLSRSDSIYFMPEDDEGGMTDEEYQAYLAEHGDDDEDEEGPVVYGAGKD